MTIQNSGLKQGAVLLIGSLAFIADSRDHAQVAGAGLAEGRKPPHDSPSKHIFQTLTGRSG